MFRGQKRFIYPRNTLKDAKISKTKIGWFVSLDTIRRSSAADAQTRRPRYRRSLFDAWNIRAIRSLPAVAGYPWLLGPLRGGEADDLLFAPDGECVLCRRQKSFLDVFLGAGNKIAAATQVELALNIFAMALNRFYTETE